MSIPYSSAGRGPRMRRSVSAMATSLMLASRRRGQVPDPRERVLAVFDWLGEWFAQPGFRGCAWINAHGELGSSSEAVLAEVRSHKRAFHEQIAKWVHATGVPVVEPVYLLAEGAIVTAGISGDPAPAHHARAAVATLLGAP